MSAAPTQLTWPDGREVGERVRLVMVGPGYRSTGSGVYRGVVRSEHDGTPIHFFTDGEVNGHPQTCWGTPATGEALTTDETPSQIVGRS